MEDERKDKRFGDLKFTWPIIREFCIFIFAFMISIFCKNLITTIVDLLHEERRIRMQERKENNEILKKQIETMDKIIFFKKSLNHETDTFDNSNYSVDRLADDPQH